MLKRVMWVAVMVGCSGVVYSGEVGAGFRVDIFSFKKDERSELKPANAQDYIKLEKQSYRPVEDRPYALTGNSAPLPMEEWTECAFSFTAESDADVRLDLRGRSKDKIKGWLLVSAIRVDGELVENGDFSKAEVTDGKTVLPGFRLNNKAEYAKGDGPDGTSAVRLHHDHTVSYVFRVKAGTTYHFSVRAKPATPPA